MPGAIDESGAGSARPSRDWETSHSVDDSRNMSEQTICARASISLAGRVNLLLTLVTAVAGRARALLVVALVDLCVCVTQLDGDVSLQLVLEADSLDAGDGLDDGGFAVSDVADGTDVDGCYFSKSECCSTGIKKCSKIPWRAMISGERGFSLLTSIVEGSGCSEFGVSR